MSTLVPFDIWLMNRAAKVLVGLALLIALHVVATYLAQLPQFDLRGISVTGDVSHYNAVTLRANVLPHLSGNFFTLDVNAARKAFESLPWVRRAVVHREFPNRLKVTLSEHRPVAYWGLNNQESFDEGIDDSKTGSDMRLLNSFGDVFDANPDEVEADNLPRLIGPDLQSVQVWTMYQRLQSLFATRDLTLTQLELTVRGGWRGLQNDDTELMFGSGSCDDIMARTERFLRTITQATATFKRGPSQLASVDLRHTDGYAIRLGGVSTVAANRFDGGKPKQVQQVQQMQQVQQVNIYGKRI